MEALLVSYLRFCSGNGVHVPLHLDGVGAFQCDVERTGVVDGLLRRPCAAQNVQAGDHPGRQGDDQLRLVQWYFSQRSDQLSSSRMACIRRAGWKQGFVFRVLPSG